MERGIYVDNDTSVILKVKENTVSAAPGLTLTNNDGRHDYVKPNAIKFLCIEKHICVEFTLLSQFGLALLDCGDNHVTSTSSGKSVQATLDVADSNDAQVLGAAVVSAVHDSANGQTEGHAVLGARNANCDDELNL